MLKESTADVFVTIKLYIISSQGYRIRARQSSLVFDLRFNKRDMVYRFEN